MVIIKLKANLSSTSHLTSQLELSLAIVKAMGRGGIKFSMELGIIP